MTTITLKIEGPPGRVPADALATVLTESLKILKDLGRRTPVTWYVTDLKIGSAVASLSADDVDDTPQRLASEYVRGLRVVESGDALPAYFSDASLTGLKRLAKPLGKQGARYLDVRVARNGTTSETARSTDRTVANITQLRSPRSRAFGSITGVLDTISLRGHGSFQVVDPVSHRPVTCQFQTNRKEDVKAALESRVTVRGVVVRNAKGQPIRVEDATFDVQDGSPPLVSVIGIDPDFTGGLTTGEYMERVCS